MPTVTKPMDKRQALAKARKLFGNTANVSFIPDAPLLPERERWRALTKEQKAAEREAQGKSHVNPFLVYCCSIGMLKAIGGLLAYNLILGQADTWEEALAIAEKTYRERNP